MNGSGNNICSNYCVFCFQFPKGNEKLPLHSRCIIPRLAALSERENQRNVFAAAKSQLHHSGNGGGKGECDGTPGRNLLGALLVNEHVNPEALAITKSSDLAMAKVI